MILIGSGISSLYCAALLSKMNYRCLVLEQHYVAGGCTHCFADKGWEFDTGVHYVGRVEKYGYLLDLVTLNEKDKVKFEKLGSEKDGWVYDVIKIRDKLHPLRAGREAFVEDLSRSFPSERKAIEKYLNLVVKCNKSADLHFFGKLFHPIYSWIIDKTLGSTFNKLARKTVKEVLDDLFRSEELKAILSGQVRSSVSRSDDQRRSDEHYRRVYLTPSILPCLSSEITEWRPLRRASSFTPASFLTILTEVTIPSEALKRSLRPSFP